MSNIPYIKFRVSQSSLDQNGRLTQASVHALGGTFTENAAYQKYLVDILAHHLAGAALDVENQRFTFTFPFKLS